MPYKLILHHTGGTDANPLADTSNHTARQVNNWHRQKWNSPSKSGWYAGYNFLIEKNGKVTKFRDVGEEGMHTKGYNKNVAVCLSGNFDRELDSPNSMPTSEQIVALRSLYNFLQIRHDMDEKIYFHRDFASKTCPGKNLNKVKVQQLLTTPPQTVNVHIITCGDVNNVEILRDVTKASQLISDASSNIIQFKFHVEHTTTDPLSIPWRDKVIKRSWYDLNVTTRTYEHTDIVMFMVPYTHWLPIKSRYAYIHRDKRLGVYTAAQMVHPKFNRRRNGGLFDGKQIPGSFTHELLHAFYFASRASKDDTHFLDFHAEHLDMRHGFLWGMNPTKLPKRDTGLMYKYTGLLTYTARELDAQHIREGRAYRTRDSQYFFKYTPKGWVTVSEEEYTNTESRLIISDYNARWVYQEMGTDVPHNFTKVRGIKSVKPKNSFQRMWFTLQGWSKELPTKHL